MDEAVTPRDLSDSLRSLLDSDKSPCLDGFRAASDICATIFRTVESIVLLPALAQTLALAKKKRHDLYDHTIRMTLFALYLAVKSNLSEEELITVATSAVFHDLGMLYINPSLMSDGRKLLIRERPHLYSHPVVAFQMLRQYPEYHPKVSTIVLEHHERLDGSGYPRGLKEDQINFKSQILLLAELACTQFSSNKLKGSLRLSVMLKLNHQKLNTALCAHLLQLNIEAGGHSHTDPQSLCGIGPIAKMELLSEVIQDWRETYVKCQRKPASPIQEEILLLTNERMTSLIKNLQATGYDPFAPLSVLIQFGEDQEVLMELEFLVREALWQVSDIIHECMRRSGEDALIMPEMLKWIERVENTLE